MPNCDPPFEDEFNCEPLTCEECGQFNCICGEEPEDIIECPGDIEEEPKEPEDIDQEIEND